MSQFLERILDVFDALTSTHLDGVVSENQFSRTLISWLKPGSTHPKGGKYEVADDQPIVSATEEAILEAIAPFISQKGKAAQKAWSNKRRIDPDFSILDLSFPLA